MSSYVKSIRIDPELWEKVEACAAHWDMKPNKFVVSCIAAMLPGGGSTFSDDDVVEMREINRGAIEAAEERGEER